MAIRRRPAKCLVGWSVKYLRCSRSRPRPDCQRTGQRQRDTSSPNTAEPRGNARLPRRAGIAAPTVNSRPTAPRPRCGRCGSAASRLPTPWLIRADTGLSDHSCLFHPDCASENCRTHRSESFERKGEVFHALPKDIVTKLRYNRPASYGLLKPLRLPSPRKFVHRYI
jgi:hypothetical protein